MQGFGIRGVTSLLIRLYYNSGLKNRKWPKKLCMQFVTAIAYCLRVCVCLCLCTLIKKKLFLQHMLPVKTATVLILTGEL